MQAPWYRDFVAAELPRANVGGGGMAIVLAGETHGVTGAVTREGTAPLYLDLHLPAGSLFSQPLVAAHNAFVYVYRGAVRIAGAALPAGRMAILANEGDGITVEAPEDARLILVAGRPLGEPIAQHGPFVMNTPEEIQQAIADYRAGRLGG
jgi:redox-sensitive bicupin YhaK (pirin superfamily)